jgi:predicted hydrocarbon binding protein
MPYICRDTHGGGGKIYSFHAIDLGRMLYDPGRNLYVFYVVLRNVVGSLKFVAEVFSNFNVNILHVAMDPVTHDVAEGHVHFYVDFTDSKASPEDVAKALEPLVVKVGYDRPFMEYPDFIIDNYHFPLRVYGERAIIVLASFMQGMFDEFKKIAGSGAEAMIWNLGYMGGYGGIKGVAEFFEKIARRKLSSYEIVKIYLTALRSLGWGIFEVSTWNEADGEFTFKVWESFESAHIKSKRETPQCFFISGVLCGVVKGLVGKEATPKETKCIAIGDEYCEFHIKYRQY